VPVSQEYCTRCDQHLCGSEIRNGRRTCAGCRSKSSVSSSTSSAPPSPPPPPLFGRESSVGHPLSPIERSAAVTLCRIGETQQHAAARINCTRQTVSHWKRKFEETGEVVDAPRSGRSRETTEEDDTLLVASSVIEPFDTPKILKLKLGLDVSVDTIDRRLVESGLPGRVAVHTYPFTEEHRRKRLSFAEGYKNWTKKQWESVLFADEASFKGAGFYGQVWVRRPPGERFDPLYTVDKKPHPVKVHFWGCFSANGVGYSHIFNQNLDAKLYKTILNNNLLASAELLFPQDPPQQWWFLEDNDPKHTSQQIKAWLHNHGVSCLDFPPYSPDLNPSENLWNDMARRLEVKQVEGLEPLQDAAAEIWEETSTKFLKKLAHSMPKRCAAVIDANGCKISF
jgi:transposase